MSLNSGGMKMDLKEAYVATLKSGIGLDMLEDITCYPISDGFLVEYYVHEENYESLDLAPYQFNLLKEEDELSEVFDNPEDAVDFFLKLRPKGKYSYQEKGKGGTLTEALTIKKKNRYFD